jgi:hypothetical protein
MALLYDEKALAALSNGGEECLRYNCSPAVHYRLTKCFLTNIA